MDVKNLGKQVLANGYQMVKSNKGILMYMGLMMVSSHCFASTTMPWDSGIESLKSNLTGPLPRAGAAHGSTAIHDCIQHLCCGDFCPVVPFLLDYPTEYCDSRSYHLRYQAECRSL